jgi:hypothetical protein
MTKRGTYKIMKRKNREGFILILFTLSCLFLFYAPVSAEKPLNISADNLEYLADTNEYIANGSVHIVYEDATTALYTLFTKTLPFRQTGSASTIQLLTRLLSGTSSMKIQRFSSRLTELS